MSSYFSNQSLWKKKNMKERKNKNNHYTNHVKNKKKVPFIFERFIRRFIIIQNPLLIFLSSI